MKEDFFFALESHQLVSQNHHHYLVLGLEIPMKKLTTFLVLQNLRSENYERDQICLAQAIMLFTLPN